MAQPSAKNALLSPAATALGLGDQLQQQLQDLEAERQKKVLALANQKPNTDLMSPAALLLFGQQGNFLG